MGLGVSEPHKAEKWILLRRWLDRQVELWVADQKYFDRLTTAKELRRNSRREVVGTGAEKS